MLCTIPEQYKGKMNFYLEESQGEEEPNSVWDAFYKRYEKIDLDSLTEEEKEALIFAKEAIEYMEDYLTAVETKHVLDDLGETTTHYWE